MKYLAATGSKPERKGHHVSRVSYRIDKLNSIAKLITNSSDCGIIRSVERDRVQIARTQRSKRSATMGFFKFISNAIYKEYDRRIKRASLITEYGASHHDDHAADHSDDTHAEDAHEH